MRTSLAWTRDHDWQELSEVLAEFTQRDFRYLREVVWPARFPETWQGRPFVPLPFVRDLTKALAPWYRRPPQRTWTGVDGAAPSEFLAQLYRALGVDAAMKAGSESLVAQQTMLGLMLPRIGERRWSLLMLSPFEVEVDPDPRDSAMVAAAKELRLRVPVSATHEQVMFGTLRMTRETIVLEGGAQRVNPYRPNGLDFSNPWASEQNPYPVFVLRATPPVTGQFFAPLPDDLFHAQIELSVALSDSVHIGSWMSSGQPVLTGAQRKTQRTYKRGPEHVLNLDDDQSFDIVAPATNLQPYLDAIQRTLAWTRVLNGLPDSPMKSSAITAVAKLMERLDQDAYRQDMLSGLERAEQSLYGVIRRCMNWNFGLPREPQLPVCDVTVQYQEPPIPQDPLHTAQAVAMDVGLGLVSPVDVIAQRSGLTPEEARQRWLQNLADRDQARGSDAAQG